jgi:hypothetical protein
MGRLIQTMPQVAVIERRQTPLLLNTQFQWELQVLLVKKSRKLVPRSGLVVWFKIALLLVP